MYKMMVSSAHVVKSSPLRTFCVSFQYFVIINVTNILQICMKQFGAKMFLYKFKAV